MFLSASPFYLILDGCNSENFRRSLRLPMGSQTRQVGARTPAWGYFSVVKKVPIGLKEPDFDNDSWTLIVSFIFINVLSHPSEITNKLLEMHSY